MTVPTGTAENRPAPPASPPAAPPAPAAPSPGAREADPARWVRRRARRVADAALARTPFALVRRGGDAGALPRDFDPATAATVAATAGYTLTPPERVFMLCEAVRYLVGAGRPGAFVECGVWRGGSALAMVRTLLELGVTDRDLWLYDTFEAMPEPGEVDVDINGVPAAVHHAMLAAGADYDHATYDYLPFDEVRGLLVGTGYPPARLHFVKGLVEDTVPSRAPDQIALLRLDTDYYASTAHELAHLYPRLTPGGVLIVDDYGHFHGARLATDEYFAARAAEGHHVLLNRIDYSARLVVVPGGSAGG